MHTVQTGVLREIVKDYSALGESEIAVPFLLRRLDLAEPVVAAVRELREARAVLQLGDVETALARITLIETRLVELVDEHR